MSRPGPPASFPLDNMLLFLTVTFTAVSGELFISHTNLNLQRVPPGLDPGVTILHLGNNQISRVENDSLDGLSQLAELSIQKNYGLYFLDDMAFVPCPLLWYINLQHTKFNIIPPLATMPSFRYSGFQYNDIYIPPTYFSKYSNISTFIISDSTFVQSVPQFHPDTPIGMLRLNRCPIKSVSDLSKLSRLVSFGMTTDLLVCDLRLCWMKFENFDLTTHPPYFDQRTGAPIPVKNVLDPNTFTCMTPPHNGTLFRNINPVLLECYNGEFYDKTIFANYWIKPDLP